jgi:hypothetical protein
VNPETLEWLKREAHGWHKSDAECEPFRDVLRALENLTHEQTAREAADGHTLVPVLRAQVAILERERDKARAELAKVLTSRLSVLESQDFARALLKARDELERVNGKLDRETKLADTALNEAKVLRAEAARLRGELESLLPANKGINGRGVDWSIACGRGYLSVAGWSVAMEGDVSRDEKTGKHWDVASIKAVVEHFNAPILAALASTSATDWLRERLAEQREACARMADGLGEWAAERVRTTPLVGGGR